MGSVELTDEKLRLFLPEDIDMVEVFTLSRNLDPANTNGFYGDFPEPLSTVGHTTLSGTNAAEVVKLWRSLRTGRNFQSMCFDPVYGLQFKRNGTIYFQTSVCWHCSAFTLPVSLFGMKRNLENGFDSKSKAGQELLRLLEYHLPLPLEPASTKPPAK